MPLKKIADYIYNRPKLHMRFSGISRLLGRATPPKFSGWGMTTESTPPWSAGLSEIDTSFQEVKEGLLKAVSTGKFRLTIFNDKEYDVIRELQRLGWRNYVVYWSACYAAKSTSSGLKNLAECGVCDGLSTIFALNAMRANGNFHGYLYDAWETMRSDTITETEKSLVGSYDFLKIKNTQRNLAEFEDNVTYIKGYLPESFEEGKNPPDLSWLHIDLNSSVATNAVLEYLFDRVLSGGIILFDDYAHQGYHETRECIDKFFKEKKGIFLPMPTGQGIFFKL